jgi:hypothetical protein
MNDMIKELAKQAGLIAPYGSDREGLRDFDYRLFAKLILADVHEVLRLVPYENDNVEFNDEVPFQQAIDKYFGDE